MVALHCVVCGLADPGGRVVEGVGLRQLAGRGCGFASRREHGYLLWVLCVVRGFCEVHSSPTECGVSEYDQVQQ